ncbi:PilZ domain-containing protein [Sphingobium sp. TCM1]|uniref:PilZ domain-containing protein n=1 Tax=Sphingobium sp. TCM1 TaxID=453246 RepID=UPI0007F437C7|nr:PilZ domain-containing protein [Sphingobium sp. TCM1]OAN56504.1 hypothetical protein A7Q26_03355 [Sphingobium sp. TCM1]
MDSIIYRARAERRREKRFAADVEAILSWSGLSEPVEIRNISIYGALLAGAWLPPVGERVTLIAVHLEVCGTVIWNGPDRCGILLSRAVDPVAIIGESGARATASAPITLRQVAPGSYA